jgi:hypothetical protein
MRHDVQFIEPTQTGLDGILSDFRWAFPDGEPRVLTYHYADTADDFFIDPRFGYDAGIDSYDQPYRNGFRALDESERALAEAAFSQFEAIADIRFEPVDDPAAADIRLAVTDLSAEGVAGLAYGPYSAELPFDTDPAELYQVAEISGDIWLDADRAGPAFYQALLQQVGIALGLSPAAASGFEFIEDIENPTLPEALDYQRYSVMSAESGPAGLELIAAADASSPMSQDILALQYLYGVASNETDDVYVLRSPNAEPVQLPSLYAEFELHEYDNSYLSIVDNGGYNVLYSPLAVSQQIDLRPDSWSSTGGGVLTGEGRDANLHLAPGTVIHELVTGGGNDLVLVGDTAALVFTAGGNDVVSGGPGSDTIRLGVGNDVYVHSIGGDVVDGNNGNDIAHFGDANYVHYKFTILEDGGLAVTDLRVDETTLLNRIEELVFGEQSFDADLVQRQVVELNRALLLSDVRPLFRSDIGTEDDFVTATEAGVYRLYYGGLGRLPDKGGFDWWLDQILKQGASFEDLAEGFVRSEEFVSLADTNGSGNVGAAEFVTHMYQNVFGRPADQAGFDWWLDQLFTSQHTYASAFASMVQSDEFVQLTAGTVDEFLFLT